MKIIVSRKERMGKDKHITSYQLVAVIDIEFPVSETAVGSNVRIMDDAYAVQLE